MALVWIFPGFGGGSYLNVPSWQRKERGGQVSVAGGCWQSQRPPAPPRGATTRWTGGLVLEQNSAFVCLAGLTPTCREVGFVQSCLVLTRRMLLWTTN